MHAHRHLYSTCFRKIIILILTFFYSHHSYAQQQHIDSLLIAIKKHPQEDTIKVKLLSELAYSYSRVFPDSTVLLSKQSYLLATSLHYEYGRGKALTHWAIGSFLMSRFELAVAQCKMALQICEKINDKRGISSLYNNLAIIYNDQGNYRAAISYYLQSLKIRKETNDHRGIASCYNNIGNTYLDMGNYSEALLYLFKGLKLREKNNDEEAVANSLSNIAGIYFHLGKYKETLDYNLRALAIDEKTGNKDGIMSSLIIIGNVYHNQKEHEKALASYTKALQISEEMYNQHSVALCLMNIGEEYVSQEKYAEAEKCFLKALVMSEENFDQTSIAMSHTNLGIICLNTNRVQQSIVHLNKGFSIASTIGNKLGALESSKHLANAYERVNDFKRSNQFIKKFVAYKDSLFNEESNKKAQQIEFDFILDKKQDEISLLQKDKSIQQAANEKQRILSLTLTLGVVLLTLIVFILYRSRQKEKLSKELILKQKQEIEKQAGTLEELNAFKDKTFSVLSHDLRSPVASLSSVMTLMDQQAISPSEFDSLKDTLNGQLKSLSLLLDNILHWAKSQIEGNQAPKKAACSIYELTSQNFSLLKEMAAQKKIALTMHVPENIKAYADYDQLDIVIRNLLSNAIKFTQPEGKVTVEASEETNHINITVTDTGVGMSDALKATLFSTIPNKSTYGTSGEKGTGIGLLLCKEFVEKNGGTISVKSEIGEGSVFLVSLPKAS